MRMLLYNVVFTLVFYLHAGVVERSKALGSGPSGLVPSRVRFPSPASFSNNFF